ncbi:glyoxalase/bleomycin resistance protein/dioxygenase [Mangrovimonas yunxiaonensis]|uniref:Glyoxalase/bleomycin resistance protein/dioxygenase n=1 Tax=Mangrovimonas yunxiaonensis TaxID=1197477 RepID=A0A084TLM7_9FLAO|nr:glyoxalase/bleomycin resistance protein/dioxygenase [Mangrovimonas yunxiaonensis]KFB01613.1 glyoxalase/bleomycin resistance protein/dioxygenase [Mangrovimonas yunxiaonensis]MBR9756774.1 bleomycin resistance protein [Algicola sp.]GGH35654.1 dioxygenase [Mangrovimonas yunxiaonensis]
METPFHLALPCISIKETKAFYTEMLKASVGRSAQNWVDINLYGHQITFTKTGSFNFDYRSYSLGDEVLPSFHFGIIVPQDHWQTLYRSLKEQEGAVTNQITFLDGKTGEHQSFFVKDPNDYTVEFKCFKTPSEIFKA